MDVRCHVQVIAASFAVFFVFQEASKHFWRWMWPSYKKLPLEDRVEWDNRFVSTFHAAVVACGSGSVIFHSAYVNDPIFGWTDAGELFTTVAVGYFYFDLLTMARFPSLVTTGQLVHHAIGITCFPLACLYRECEYAVVLFVFTEVTTPFVNIRWFLMKSGLRFSRYYDLNGVFMFLGFLLVRVMMTPYILRFLYLNKAAFLSCTNEILALCSIALSLATVLNYYWFALIALGFIKLLFEKKTGVREAEEVDKVSRFDPKASAAAKPKRAE
eukprot:gnl/Hemi2/19740_TR6551_c0_g1_i1.p2 gnl/Hemi2/19740_TR6551_c0_g1~~gnl/Hemi2/19740_TR6551_c0_g1_i1.p2  ORF type:complete len:271 (-),score=88.30 gnl/Hemi2/19740_TR6551_c0_g1_i1:185-997(-)